MLSLKWVTIWLRGQEPACQWRRPAEDMCLAPGWGRSLAGEATAHSSILAWKKSTWTEEPGRQFMSLQRVGHNWETRWQQHLKLTQQRKSIIVKKKKSPQEEPFCCRCFAVASLPSDSSEIFPSVMALFLVFSLQAHSSKFSLVKTNCWLSCLKEPHWSTSRIRCSYKLPRGPHTPQILRDEPPACDKIPEKTPAIHEFTMSPAQALVPTS